MTLRALYITYFVYLAWHDILLDSLSTYILVPGGVKIKENIFNFFGIQQRSEIAKFFCKKPDAKMLSNVN